MIGFIIGFRIDFKKVHSSISAVTEALNSTVILKRSGDIYVFCKVRQINICCELTHFLQLRNCFIILSHRKQMPEKTKSTRTPEELKQIRLENLVKARAAKAAKKAEAQK
jgi:ribosomal protein L36